MRKEPSFHFGGKRDTGFLDFVARTEPGKPTPRDMSEVAKLMERMKADVERQNRGFYIATSFVAILVVGAIFFFGVPYLRGPRTAADRQDMEAWAQIWVTDRLKDPDSARFGPMRSLERDGYVFMCGTVSARNSFGGYANPQAFLVMIDKATQRGGVVKMDDSGKPRAALWACQTMGLL